MTVIIGIKNNKKVYLASDGQATSGQYISSCSKIFKKKLKIVNSNSEVVDTVNIYFAGTGSGLSCIWLEHAFKVPNKHENDSFEEYLTTDFIRGLKAQMSTTGMIEEKSGKIDTDTMLIIVVNNKMYELYSNLGINVPEEEYIVNGSGTGVALGSLYSTKDLKMKVEDRIKLAIEACAHHTIYCDNSISLVKCD